MVSKMGATNFELLVVPISIYEWDFGTFQKVLHHISLVAAGHNFFFGINQLYSQYVSCSHAYVGSDMTLYCNEPYCFRYHLNDQKKCLAIVETRSTNRNWKMALCSSTSPPIKD